MYTVAICDDRIEFREILKSYLNKYMSPNNYDLQEYSDGADMYLDIEKGICFDVAFLDLYMPEMGGIQIGDIIRKSKAGKNTIIVFLTAYNETNLTDLVRVKPFDYIYKNDLATEYEFVVNKIVEELESRGDKFEFRENRNLQRINQSQIKYIEAYKNKMHIVTVDAEYDTRDYSIKKLASILNNLYMVQCNASAIINSKYIKTFKPTSVIMDDGKEFSIGKNYKINLKKMMECRLSRRIIGK